jgi:hypothetical protein
LAGDVERAAVLVCEALERHPEDPIVVSLQGLVYAFRGERGLAMDCVHQACAMPRSFGHSHHTYYQIAGIHSLLGESTEALAWLERAVNTGFPCWPFFSIDPALSNLQSLPQFQNLVRALQGKYSKVALG